MIAGDERFQSVDANRFAAKPVKRKLEKEGVPGLLKTKNNSKKVKVEKKLNLTEKKDANRIKRKR